LDALTHQPAMHIVPTAYHLTRWPDDDGGGGSGFQTETTGYAVDGDSTTTRCLRFRSYQARPALATTQMCIGCESLSCHQHAWARPVRKELTPSMYQRSLHSSSSTCICVHRINQFKRRDVHVHHVVHARGYT
jgi:hypothetical protein